MQVHGLGVLIIGHSGVGKSELALELLTRGHQLVADDATEFVRRGAGIEGRCPPLLNGFMEARSLGILNARRMFGTRAIRARHMLHLIVELEFRASALKRVPDALERISGRRQPRALLGAEVEQITVPIRLGHNLAVLVEAACRDFSLRRRGYRADEDFTRRQLKAIKNNSA